MRRSMATALALVSAACASGGGGTEAPPVPVYTAADVPCEYEVMRTVRRSPPSRPRTAQEFERLQTSLLGQAGANVGADAVVVAAVDLRQTGTAVSRQVVPGTPRTSGDRFEFEGEAVRFIPGTCR